MDYLDSIDCSLEDFQAMLYGKQFGMDVDVLEVNTQTAAGFSAVGSICSGFNKHGGNRKWSHSDTRCKWT